MFSKMKYLAVAAVLAVTPLVASAATLIEDGNSYTIGYAEDEFFGNIDSVGGAGSWSVVFNADADPVSAESSATIGRIVFAQFKNLTMSWLDSSMNVLSTINIGVGDTVLSTVFTVPNLSQTLLFTWTNSTAGAGFDVEVAAAVPLPAGGSGDIPSTWSEGAVCFQRSTPVAVNGAVVTQEVVSAACMEGWEGYCPPTCSASVGSTFSTVDPIGLIGG